MNKVTEKLTIFFDKPFWIGVFERIEDGKLSVCKVTFGAEPKDYEVYEFVLAHYYRLKFSKTVETDVKKKKLNPKSMRREAKKQQSLGIGTKSQQALKLQHEQMKTESKKISRRQHEAEKQRQFELKQEKRREKHKGH